MGFQEGKFYTDKACAEILNVGRSTLWGWLKKGQFVTPVKFGARTTRFDGSELLAWQAARKAGEQ